MTYKLTIRHYPDAGTFDYSLYARRWWWGWPGKLLLTGQDSRLSAIYADAREYTLKHASENEL